VDLSKAAAQSGKQEPIEVLELTMAEAMSSARAVVEDEFPKADIKYSRDLSDLRFIH